jgi:hypothetical protein
MSGISIVGGGIAGLVAAITSAEAEAEVTLFEGHDDLGGRARSAEGPYKANLGPHVLYKDGPFCRWLRDRDLMPVTRGVPLAPIRFRWEGDLRRTPPLATAPAVLRLRGRQAPADRDFRGWATDHTDARTAQILSAAAGVYTFHHDPGELSAEFVWGRTVRTLLNAPPPARYVTGGWNALVELLAGRARQLGVRIETGHCLTSLPEPPVIVATEIRQARELLGEDSLEWPSGRTVCLDLGIEHRRGDPFVVSDLDDAGWFERYSAADSSLAPDGEELIQAQMPIRPDESPDQACLRLEKLIDLALPDWRERETWRRRTVMDGRSGALDFPGTSWSDRPAVDRGDGVFVAGDMMASPGLLSEVAWGSGVEAARGAVETLAPSRPALRAA